MTEQMEMDRPRDLVATLSGGITMEELQACKEVGMNWVRIHGEKTSVKDAADMIEMCHKIGLKCSYDTNGKKPRVRKSEGMFQVADGPEKGNWLKTLDVDEQLILIAEDEDKDLIFEREGIESDTFAIQMNYIPQVFSGGGEEKVSFADGKIVCSVKGVVKEGDCTRAILVAVDSVTDTEGLYWKMGANSTTNDIFSGDDPVLTESDLKRLRQLRQLLLDDQPDQIAISFVSTGNQAADAVRTLHNLGFTGEVLAKIETMRGVENAAGIAKHCDLEVARGDLEEACKLSRKMTLDEAEGWIIKAGWESGRKVVIATHVADSLLQKVKEGRFRDGEKLSEREGINIMSEFPVADGFMLAAETKTLPAIPHGRDIIRITNRALDDANAYWRNRLRLN